jgi:hypothetical protein
MIFNTEDETAHGLAVRVLWVVLRGVHGPDKAAERFASLTEHFCCGPKFSAHIKNSLFTLLLAADMNSVTRNTDEALTISFWMKVTTHHIWQVCKYTLSSLLRK